MSKYGKIVFWIWVILVLLFAGYRFYNLKYAENPTPWPARTSGADSILNNSAPLQAAPDLVLQDTKGQTVKLSDYRGKVVILNFWASWCPPCKAEMPDLDKLGQELAAGQDAVVLAVDLTDGVRETADKAKKYINDNQFSLRVLLDSEGQAAAAYKITSIPSTFIIDKQGMISDHIVGSTTKDALMAYINKLK